MNLLPRCIAMPVLLTVLVLLSACTAEFSADLTDGPLDDASQVILRISGVELLDEDGNKFELDSTAVDAIDLLDYQNGDTLELVRHQELAAGRYVGIRLVFEDSGSYVKRDDGSSVTISPGSASTFADIDLDVAEDESPRLLLDLDLRFSLADRISTTGSYLLNPHLRAMDADKTSSISGSVDDDVIESDSCRQGRTLARGVAVYVYEGGGVSPADFYSAAIGPIASATVRARDDASGYRYDLPYLPQGSYTLALTCNADDDDPLTQDAITFVDQASIALGLNESETLNF